MDAILSFLDELHQDAHILCVCTPLKGALDGVLLEKATHILVAPSSCETRDVSFFHQLKHRYSRALVLYPREDLSQSIEKILNGE